MGHDPTVALTQSYCDVVDPPAQIRRVAPIDATGHLPGELDDAELARLAERLVATLASIRRGRQRLAGRPSEVGALSSAEMEVLRVVHRQPGISVAETAHELGVAPNTVSTLVRRLTDAGIVERRVADPDRRVARLTLVVEIQERFDASWDRGIDAVASVIHDLSRRQQRQLVTVVPTLEALARGLEQPWRDR